MKTQLKLVAIFVFLFALGLFAKPLLAAVRCETQYVGEVCIEIELLIDKKVWDPKSKAFADNLGVNDYRFAPGEEITFKLKIKNVGDETLDKVDVRDYLPSYLEHISGDLSFEIIDLSVNETEEREIKVKVVPADQFPKGESIICVINKAEAWTDEEKDDDTAQVCLEKKVLGAIVQPEAGTEILVLGLGFLGISGLGLILKKKLAL